MSRAARRFYASAVQQGSAAAARNLGRLYDPIYIERTAMGGIDPDLALARHWYERAVAMGDPEAAPLLEVAGPEVMMHRRTLLSALPAAAFAAGLNPTLAAVGQPVTIGIMGGEIDGTFMRVATDLTSVLNSNDMRIVPIVGKGSLQNIGDLLHLPGVDLAMVAADALTYAQTAHLYPGDLGKIQYICKLYENDVHVCARPEIQSLSDLQGKPVNIDVDGAGTNLTARAILKMLGIAPDLRYRMSRALARKSWKRGEIAANIYCAGKPVRLFANAPAGTGLHFISVPSNEEMEKVYAYRRSAYACRIPDAGPGRCAGRDGGRRRYACGFRMAAGVQRGIRTWSCSWTRFSPKFPRIAEAATPSGVAQR